MKKALLVGINNYQNSPLNGCVNDVILINAILTQRLGFKQEDVKILIDNEATKINIENQLKQLVANVQNGDTIVFHYSGHGSQVPNNRVGSIEIDRKDEILCPVDLNWENVLRDNDLNIIFNSVPSGVKPIVILDCCHSGTGVRAQFYNTKVGHFKNRYLQPPIEVYMNDPIFSVDISGSLKQFDLIDSAKNLFRSLYKRIFSTNSNIVDTNNAQGNTVLISGCKDHQYSADAYINNKYHGALTYVLYEVLSLSNYNISYKNLITQVNSRMKKYKFTQQPQLECKKDFFDINFLK